MPVPRELPPWSGDSEMPTDDSGVRGDTLFDVVLRSEAIMRPPHPMYGRAALMRCRDASQVAARTDVDHGRCAY
jgi:hypothetical protein